MFFVAIFCPFLLLNFAFTLPYLPALGFVNEDIVLITGAVSTISDQGFLQLFTSSYGPKIIRPLQLIGMYLEYQLFGMEPLPSQIVSLLLVALSQSILFVTLLPYAGRIGAFFGASLFAFSLNAAEPRFWLSDRHDLYLLLFFALTLYSAFRFLQEEKGGVARWSLWLLTVSLSFWACFYSNEKGTAVPPIVCAVGAAMLVGSAWPVRATARARFGVLCVVSVVHLAGYLLVRRAVLGEVIGYTGSVLPEGGVNLDNLLGWVAGVCAVPFRQPTIAAAQFLGMLTAPFLVLAIFFVARDAWRKRRLLRMLLVALSCMIALFLASVPTLRFNTGGWYESGLNSRLVWLPSIVASLLIGLLLGRALHARVPLLWRRVLGCGFLFLLVSSVQAGRVGGENFARAADYSREAVAGFARYCECYGENLAQVAGLASYPFGVNTFSEQEWFFSLVRRAGVPRCEKEQVRESACRVVVDVPNGLVAVAPARISPQFQAAFLNGVPQDPALLLGDSFRSLRFVVDAVPSGEALRLGAPVVLSGWAREQKTAKAPELFYLLADERVLVAAPPNSKRDAKLGKKRRAAGGVDNFGFAVAIDPALIPPGTETLRLVALGRSEVRGGAWAARTLAKIDLSATREARAQAESF